MARLCKYCDKEAVTMAFRECDGQVSKELVCNRCFGSTNEEIKKFDKRKDNIL